jgi:RNA polymerase sigma factor (sigma-70 family)
MFELYSKKLLSYAQYHWKTEPDPTWDLIYKTMYKVTDVIHEYKFESEQKFASFIFKIFINYLRNHLRDIKTATQGTVEVELNESIIQNYSTGAATVNTDPALKILQEELEKLEDWQRILLLMRGQSMSYAEIVKYVDKPEEQLKVYYARLKKQIAEKINERLKTQNLKNV